MIALATVVAGALRVLTLSDAVALAQRNQPQLLIARANTEAAEARVLQRRAPLLPQLSATAFYQRTTFNSAPFPGVTGTAVPARNSPDTANNWSFGLTLQQLVWDFGLSYQAYKASQALAGAQSSTEKASVLTVEQQVRTSYFSARAQKALVQVATETIANQDRHLQQIEGFVRVGSRPEIDLVQAKTDRANAQVQLINAENGYFTAKAQLAFYIGLNTLGDYDVADDTLPAIDGEDQDMTALVDEAVKARPEIASLEQQVEAQRRAETGAKGAYAPAFSVSTSGTARGIDISDMAYNWNAGINMSWGIFSGLQTYGTVKEAHANRLALEAQLAGEKLQVRLDVEQARLSVRAAKAAVTAAQEAETNARERLRLAEGRYQAGVGNIIELGDAQVAMTNASAQRVQAEYSVASARAQLLRALGRR
jgi:outer membrane protein